MVGYSVRLPKDVLREARALAKERGISTGTWLREVIEQAVAARNQTDSVPVAALQRLIDQYVAPSPSSSQSSEQSAAVDVHSLLDVFGATTGGFLIGQPVGVINSANTPFEQMRSVVASWLRDRGEASHASKSDAGTDEPKKTSSPEFPAVVFHVAGMRTTTPRSATTGRYMVVEPKGGRRIVKA
ncbi:hypothetical protein [Nocardia sp. NPDC047038]|uniref:hypothetical protein n=1 Tax=Nocardia sp. NPDC047038 TaxID=3154338 RepID=UPI0033EB040F